MCSTLGVTRLASTAEIQRLMSSWCTSGAPVWDAKAYMYLQTALVFLTALYMHIISPSVKSEAISG